ncbi:hypothetical protein F7734_56170 [Scytonema sp. UIC 10036]|uniref:hypothetical protein n=1 Tax=Scytonema sp. UIC 10036 TaxID=2304196 RepID=UPI0012DA424E|nr:hypothetical protein [Scytonema sp. UIC 10036]MUH01114.1 hypothetical protein [Scytonema sp. UIC 10036]
MNVTFREFLWEWVRSDIDCPVAHLAYAVLPEWKGESVQGLKLYVHKHNLATDETLMQGFLIAKGFYNHYKLRQQKGEIKMTFREFLYQFSDKNSTIGCLAHLAFFTNPSWRGETPDDLDKFIAMWNTPKEYKIYERSLKEAVETYNRYGVNVELPIYKEIEKPKRGRKKQLILSNT